MMIMKIIRYQWWQEQSNDIDDDEYYYHDDADADDDDDTDDDDDEGHIHIIACRYVNMCFHILKELVCSGKRYIGKELGVSEPGKAPPQDASDRCWYFHRQEIFTDKKYSQTRHIHRQDNQWQVDI